MHVISLPTLDSTRRLAHAIACGLRSWNRQLSSSESSVLQCPMTIAIQGPLGAGKTQWVRFFCERCGVSPEEVTSPTYVLLQRYRSGMGPIYHFDYYRLQNAAQAWDLGIDELQEQPVMILVEWADKFPETLAADRIELEIEYDQERQRWARLIATGPKASHLLGLSHLENLSMAGEK